MSNTKTKSLIMRKLLLWAATAAVAAVAAGCTTEKENLQYVRTDTALCTFLAEGNAPLTVKVEASGNWEATPQATWIKVGDLTATSFTLTVEDNESYTDTRESSIELTCGEAVQEIKVIQLQRDNDAAVYQMYAAYDMGAAMSPSGRYCVGTRHVLQPDNTYYMYPTFHNLDTGEITEIGPLLYGSPLSLEKPIAVTDQGTAFIYGPDNHTVAITVDGDYFIPESPEGYHQPNISAVSEDGKIWVGYCWGETMKCSPVIWRDGVPELLEMPELDYRGVKVPNQVMARGMSLDGSVIYGTQWEFTDTGMIYWKDGKLQNVGKDIFKLTPVSASNGTGGTYETNLIEAGMYCFAETHNISPNGKWIAGKYQEESMDENGLITKGTTYPAFYNTETETTTVMRDYPDCTAVTATNDGLGIIGDGTTMMSTGKVVEIESGAYLGTCLEYIQEQWGITVSTGYISYIPASGDRCLGTMMVSSALGVSFTQFSVSPRPVK